MSEQQISRNHGEESSQTIHDADTLISTSLSTSNEALENDADTAAVEVESEDDSDSEEMEWVEETSTSLLEACQNREWQTFEKFLSDESISKRKKKLVLEEEECRNFALRFGAPLAVIKYLIDIEGKEMISKGDCSWLHLALMYYDTTFEVVKLLVDIGGKDLVNMQSNHPDHRKRTALHIHLGLSAANSKPV